jgi:hypothetical protein
VTPYAIPERAPLGDSWTGLVLQAGTAQVLSPVPLPNTTIIASGNFIIRYGLRFLGKLHQSIVPGLIVLDYGDFLTGEEAWDFLIRHSNLHPRAEVVGYRSDGADDMVVIKNLDMAVDPQVLVYTDSSAVTPAARPEALIASDITALPARLIQYLPHYPTLHDWQADHDR